MFSNDTTRAMDAIGGATIDELEALLGSERRFSAEDLIRIVEAKARIAEANVIMTMTNEQKLQFAQIKYGNNSGIK